MLRNRAGCVNHIREIVQISHVRYTLVRNMRFTAFYNINKEHLEFEGKGEWMVLIIG